MKRHAQSKFKVSNAAFYQENLFHLIQHIVDEGMLIQAFHVYKLFRDTLNSEAFFHVEKAYIQMLFDHR